VGVGVGVPLSDCTNETFSLHTVLCTSTNLIPGVIEEATPDQQGMVLLRTSQGWWLSAGRNCVQARRDARMDKEESWWYACQTPSGVEVLVWPPWAFGGALDDTHDPSTPGVSGKDQCANRGPTPLDAPLTGVAGATSADKPMINVSFLSGGRRKQVLTSRDGKVTTVERLAAVHTLDHFHLLPV
jgi:hypothetical protein